MSDISPASSPGVEQVALRAQGICKQFSGVVANDHVDFDLRVGEIHALVGENGAGKTTLMNICFGLERPDAGAIWIEGEPAMLASPADALARHIVMVHQHFMLVPVFTVLENVVLGREPTGPAGVLTLGEARERLVALAVRYGLDADPDAVVESLSVGAQQRVEILKALYRDARVLILDEPTAVLTPQETADLFVVLRRLSADGVGVVLITHKLHEVLEVADRITVMRRGQVVGTRLPGETNPAELATLIVGRPVLLQVDKDESVPGDVVLRVRDLHVRDARGLHAIDGVSFEVRAGEIFGIAGVQGNGQTELIEALVGLRPIAGGEITGPDGRQHATSPRVIRLRGTAHIPEDRQRDGLVGGFSLADNLVLCAHDAEPFSHWGVRLPGVIRRHARALLAAFDVRPRDERAVAATLSGGNQQKVILARELADGVRLVIANQPTRGLDVGSIEEIHRRLVALRDQGAGVLLVSGELDELLGLADRIGVLYRGRLVLTVPAGAATPEALGLAMAGSSLARAMP